MQTFETLMLRLTTKVTVSPASSARSSSAAARRSSIGLGPGLGEQRGQLVGRQPPAGARLVDGAGREARPDRPGRLGAAGPAAGDEAPEARLDDVEHALVQPLRVEVLRVDAQALGQRDAVLLEPAAHAVGRGERVLGRDVVAVGAQAAEVGGAGGDELGPPVGQVGRHLDADARQQLACRADERAHVVERHRRGPRGRRHAGRPGQARAPELLGRLGRDLAGLLTVVAAVRARSSGG